MEKFYKLLLNADDFNTHKPSSELTRLFTYGTLKRGFDNPFAQKLHANASYVGKGFFHGKLYKIDWYPGAVYEPGSAGKVYGDIFQIQDPELLRELDEYEEVLEDEAASLYIRREIPIFIENESTMPCWTYLFNQPVQDLGLIESGIFAN
ncbi:gamma-glutamylcyclotransferase family protein [Dyadobacter aurulentus]|uniref:gamma-glutamylcyclotransferase family protein n=1 Tax=Dyadobacter sp. UC 10 TaxID=2605428 RepID=UPI0011F1A7BB|nr:gamma-glutamylcyclotransferase family protein [Dyadobacter sp. UC 10]KAA0990838.1 gamma-glutamylcyclotransferase [Dyadobacter sp. UC 10]